MARYYTNNGIYFQDSRGPKTVFKYVNETTKRLYCNQFDLFPDVYAATYGSVTILRNGIKEFSSQSTDGATNPLRRYVQYSVSDRLRWLDRGESLEIVLEHDKDNTTIKLGISLELDFTAAPGPAQNITRDPLTLGIISETLLLADGVVFDRQKKSTTICQSTSSSTTRWLSRLTRARLSILGCCAMTFCPIPYLGLSILQALIMAAQPPCAVLVLCPPVIP